jgi:hypothetical protein
MRDKDWLVKVLEEASERVEAWPDWKKSSELQQTQQQQENRNGNEHAEEPRFRCA